MKKKIVVLLVALMMFSLIGCSKKEIKASDYISITTSGLNGYGSLDYEINLDSNKDIVSLDCIPSKISDLKNGDVVVFSCEIHSRDSKDNDVITKDVFEYTVSGLEEVSLIEVTDLYDYKVIGRSGKGQVILEPKTDNDMINDLDPTIKAYRGGDGEDYRVSNKEIENGDKITLTVDAYSGEEFYKKYNALPDPTPVEFFADGLGTLVTSEKEITEEYISLLEEPIANYIENRREQYGIVEDKYEKVDTFFRYQMNSTTKEEDNDLGFIYSYYSKNNANQEKNCYLLVYMTNITTSDKNKNCFVQELDAGTAVISSKEFNSLEEARLDYDKVEEYYNYSYKTW